MRNNILAIIKKEFVRFFGDKRMALTTILLPGLMIYVMYSILGEGMMGRMSADEDYVYHVSVVNMPQSMETMMENMPVQIENVSEKNEGEMAKVADKETDLFLVYQEDFDGAVASYDSETSQGAAPQIEMYYNSTKPESSEGYQMMIAAFDSYESMLANKFDVNGREGTYDLASDKDETGMFFSMMLPMLLMIFLFSGCMGIAPEAIAGEKERGTIATLLVTPMKRSHLALGKIISLGVIGLLSGLSSFIGTMLSLPKMMGGESGSIGVDVYGAGDYVMLLFVILATVLIMVAALSVISAYAKSVKEASTAILPLMVIVMVIAFSSMLGDGAPTQWYWYLLPFYNSVQCMNGIFAFAALPVNIVITVVSNLVYVMILAAGLAKMFDSEKIMYL